MAGGRNSTTITEFILLGFSEFSQLTAVLFSIFLGIYLVTVYSEGAPAVRLPIPTLLLSPPPPPLPRLNRILSANVFKGDPVCLRFIRVAHFLLYSPEVLW